MDSILPNIPNPFVSRPRCLVRYEWEGGCEDPRVVKGAGWELFDDLYGLRWDHGAADDSQLSRPFHWTKHGPAFSATPGH